VGEGFCFLVAVEMYWTNPDGITWRIKQLQARMLASGRVSVALPVEPPATVPAKGLAYPDRFGNSAKVADLRVVFTANQDDQTLDQVRATTGCSRGAVSGCLHELEWETNGKPAAEFSADSVALSRPTGSGPSVKTTGAGPQSGTSTASA
jgi:hypothetical protein